MNNGNRVDLLLYAHLCVNNTTECDIVILFILLSSFFFRVLRCRSHEVDYEESLILLEYHAVLDGLLLVKIIPRAICALFSVASVLQYPVAVLVFDCCLHL